MECQHGLSGKYLPVHPHPLDDELLSSWLLRTAHSNCLKLHSFVSETLGAGYQVITRDIDRLATASALEALSASTGSTVAALRKGLISDLAGSLVDQHTPNGNCRWILPLGIYHRTRQRFGLQFCSSCLATDTTPYFRRKWRLAFNTICDRHGCLLHDRCPTCLAPVVPARTEVGKRRGYAIEAHTICYKCGADLRRAASLDPPGLDGKGLYSLRSLCTFYDLGWWFVGTEILPYSISYYDGLRHLIQFLTTDRGVRVLKRIWNTNTSFQDLPFSIVPSSFEQKALLERHYLLTSALWLLDDWPHRLVAICKDLHVTASRISLGYSLPYWMESTIREQLSAGTSTSTSEEAESVAAYLLRHNKPITCKAVGELLGKTDAKASQKYSSFRPALTSEERDKLIAALSLKAGSHLDIPVDGARTKRDLVILRLLKLTSMRIGELLQCRTNDCGCIIARVHDTASAKEVERIVVEYLREIRPILAHAKTDSENFFLGVTGVGLNYKNWGQYLKKLKQDHLNSSR
jgi:integrase